MPPPLQKDSMTALLFVQREAPCHWQTDTVLHVIENLLHLLLVSIWQVFLPGCSVRQTLPSRQLTSRPPRGFVWQRRAGVSSFHRNQRQISSRRRKTAWLSNARERTTKRATCLTPSPQELKRGCKWVGHILPHNTHTHTHTNCFAAFDANT